MKFSTDVPATNTWSRLVLMGASPSPAYADSIITTHPTTGTLWITGATKFNQSTVGRPAGLEDALWPHGTFAISTIAPNGGL